MMAVEERLAHVEGLVTGQSALLADLRTSVNSLEGRVDRRFDQIESRLTAVEQKVEAKADGLHGKIDDIERRLGQRIDGTFRWTIGVMVSLSVAVIASVVAAALSR